MDLQAFLILTIRLCKTPTFGRALLRLVTGVPCLLVNHVKLRLAQVSQLAFTGLLLVGALPTLNIRLLLAAARDILF